MNVNLLSGDHQFAFLQHTNRTSDLIKVITSLYITDIQLIACGLFCCNQPAFQCAELHFGLFLQPF